MGGDAQHYRGGEIGNPMGITFQERQWVLPHRDHFQSTAFEKGESLSLGENFDASRSVGYAVKNVYI